MLNCKLKHLIQLRFFVIIVMENNNFRVEILSLRHYFGQLALDIWFGLGQLLVHLRITQSHGHSISYYMYIQKSESPGLINSVI